MSQKVDFLEKNFDISITPEVVIDFGDKDFQNYESLKNYLEKTLTTQGDLITLLHFSKVHGQSSLENINSRIWLKKSGTDKYISSIHRLRCRRTDDLNQRNDTVGFVVKIKHPTISTITTEWANNCTIDWYWYGKPSSEYDTHRSSYPSQWMIFAKILLWILF